MRLLLVDDHPLMREGIKQLLHAELNGCFIFEADNGMDACKLAALHSIDTIILDLYMPGLSGFDTITLLKQQGFSGKIIVFSVSDNEKDKQQVLSLGAILINKNTNPAALIESLTLADNAKFGNLELATTSYSALKGVKGEEFYGLTGREFDVLHCVAEGQKNKQISTRLYISESTVKVHVKSILKKLGVHSRLAATLRYLEWIN